MNRRQFFTRTIGGVAAGVVAARLPAAPVNTGGVISKEQARAMLNAWNCVYEPLGDPGDGGMWSYDARQNTITRGSRPNIGDRIEICYDSQVRAGLTINIVDSFIADGRSEFALRHPLLMHRGYVVARSGT